MINLRKPLHILLALLMVLGTFFTIANTASAEGTGVAAWADLQAAFNAGGEITLTADITAGSGDVALVVPSGKTVTLDLAGHTIDPRPCGQ